MPVKMTNFTHGTTIDNEDGISTGCGYTELSKLGIEQSINLGIAIKDRHFDAIYHSDLLRSIDSAKFIFDGREIPFHEDSQLRECNYGDLTGGPSEIIEPLYAKNINTPFPNGESMKNVEKRIAALLTDIKQKYDGKTVAIVGHKAPQLALEVLLNGKTWEETIKTDWRITKSWQPGWEYILK